jgi:hypothetical protein
MVEFYHSCANSYFSMKAKAKESQRVDFEFKAIIIVFINSIKRMIDSTPNF